jgi:endonuclease YncB( thermonuclease family)
MRFLAFVFIIITFNSMARVPEMEAISGRVFDGDTFNATVFISESASIRANIRFIDIDAPELSGECESEIEWAIRSKQRLEQLLPEGTKIILSNIKDDKYLGRINANVRFADGRDISKIMLDENMAVPYSGGKRIDWCQLAPASGRRH